MIVTFPRPSRTVVLVTQVLLGALFLVGVAALAFLPGLSADVADGLPEYADLRSPLLALAIAVTILGTLALGMVMLLVRRISRGTVFARSSLLWVDVVVACLLCAALLVAFGFIVISNGQAGSPFLALAQVLACLGLATLASILVVLRSLLGQAIALREELDEVV
ncbi:DUF2975 domain-containing protein [Microbacterium sp.]|uniref:DUF2975 domain-containing protein n=1 Tax=Microbacterium sp. TaxID=51671 RepID=UPI003C757A69